LPAGTVISVFGDDGLTQAVLVHDHRDQQPTGYVRPDEHRFMAFAQGPVYLSYSPNGVGTMTFGF